MKIPHELFREAPWWPQFQTSPYLAQNRGPCPRCGGTKRFQLRYLPQIRRFAAICWVCHLLWFPDNAGEETRDVYAKFSPPPPSPPRLPNPRAWLPYYRTLRDMPQKAYTAWASRGVYRTSVHRFRLGYCPRRRWWNLGQTIYAPSLVIPFFDRDKRLRYLQHRILGYDELIRYRPDRKGMSPYFWLSELEGNGNVIIVEGAIKGIVVSQALKYQTPVVAYPNLWYFNDELKAIVLSYHPQQIWVIPDPDTPRELIERFELPFHTVKFVWLSEKIDDYIRRLRLTPRQVEKLLENEPIHPA